MTCPRCSAPVERVWTGKKTVVVEPGVVTAFVPMPGQPDVYFKTTGVRVSHRCRPGTLAAIDEENGELEPARSQG